MALFRRKGGIPAATHAEVSALRDELERQQRFTEVLLETIEIGIVFCDGDGSGWVRNRAERALLGLDVSAAQGKTPEAAARLVDVLDLSGRAKLIPGSVASEPPWHPQGCRPRVVRAAGSR